MNTFVKDINKQFIEVPVSEYALLKDFYEENKSRAALSRIYEAERNFLTGNVKKISSDAFLKKIKKWSSM